MPIDKLEVKNVFITNPDTGEKTELKGVSTLTMTTDETSQYEPIKAFDSKGFTGTLEKATTKLVMKVLRDILYKSFTVRGSIEEIVREVFLNMPLGHEVVDLEFKQNKTHKKKRINKKWKKRYGYTCKVYYVEGNLR